MSNTHQEEHIIQPEHSDVENTQLITYCVDDTPVKQKHGPNQTFTVEPCNFKEAWNELDLEMEACWWGLMPAELFLKEFLPPAKVLLPHV